MDPVRYRILGTTQALRDDGTPVPVGGARLRALLTVLALRPGRTVPTAVLVDEVWGADPPADATGALQALVGRLRRALGADAIASAEGGYRLRAAADDIDLHRFERLAGEGVRALADGDPGKAAVVLDDALALWRGPALADLPDRTAESSRWEARRLDAHRARLAAALALGQAEQYLPDLTVLSDAHPLDEPLQLLRLRALRDAGRTAEALAGYESVRQLLADRLGTDPGPELRSLHGELLRGETSRNGHRPTSYEQSYEQTPGPNPPSGTRDRPAPFGDLRPAPLGNLRARLTSFVGRHTDLETIRGDLGSARLVTLLGPGGAGKTRLSQEAAESVAASVPDGVWLAELAPVDDQEAVPEAVLTAVGARETVLRGAGAEEMRAVTDRHDDPLTRLTEHCANRRMLIVLDNCEHVVDAAARLVEQLLERCPGLTVLATSREPLGVPGELLRPVEPLPEPYALKLLADRGAAARPGFRVEDDAEAAAEICRRLDGLPLAIELAAARLRMLTPRQIADRLDNRFRLLTSGSRTVLPRQQTLRAVVDWSWDLLDADERDVLRRLSVFAGGCDLAAAEAVCGPAALDALGSLVDKSLVVAAPSSVEGADGGMRYRLLETVAEYAGQRLDESGERPAAERAHLTYYRELARTTDQKLRGPGQRAAIELLQVEGENTRAALQHAVAEHDEQEALCLVLSLAWYWQIRDLRTAARNWTREIMALGPDPFAPPAEPAVPIYEPCTATPPPMRPEVLAEARRGVHLLHLACMDLELETWQTPEAEAKLLAITETYQPGFPQVCRNPGFLWFYAVMLTGDMDRLREVIDASVATCRELGYQWELAGALHMRANILANRADWAGDATRDADESLEIFDRIGDAWGAAEALSARGEARERKGEYQLAATDYRAAITHAERLGARAQTAILTTRLGSVLIDSGEAERGERMLRDVLEQGHGARNEAMPAARLFLAMWLGRTGRLAEARTQMDRMRVEFAAVHFVVFDGYVLGVEAWLNAMDGLHDEAVTQVRGALQRAQDPLSVMISPNMMSAHLTTAALALSGADGGQRVRDAARCLGAADGLLPSGHFRSAMERDVREHAETAVRAALDEAAYEAAYAEGGGLSPEEAAALV
ncbi:AfsR/SARP family transcriptional regulator [Streptomyces phaeochromogenes]|uniref:AfsR/SARP family transcriptional regulator n=1 Tax=Streptomyces phaeochromogenes TaxID=1923 RepID=UPI002DDC42F2|nr:BTAD domain-containing putative transcriptional regulator [Streptomyces phaeochromogenes]WRZ36388.1 winged helix-turn-helix domain-containing protein [Streptomyces phaeochromogenes]